MRQVIIIVSMLFIIFYSGLSILKVNDESTRKDELEMAVASALQQTVECSKPSNNKEISSDKEMMAMFMKNFFLNINSDSEIEISFMGVDYEKGLLDVEVKETYVEVTGKEKEISVRKTAIYE